MRRELCLPCVCFLAATMLVVRGVRADDFPVLDGARQAVIVRRDAPGWMEASASDDLAKYLEKSTGKKFPIVAEKQFKPAKDLFPIYVGRCRITSDVLGEKLRSLDQHGYVILVEPERVFLVGAEAKTAVAPSTPQSPILFGPHDLGTCWAIDQFLEDELGIRWLIPSDLGEDVPHHDRIVVTPKQSVEQPAIPSRCWSGVDNLSPEAGLWSRRMRVAGRYSFHHNLTRIFNPETVFDKHPEFFPVPSPGKDRYRPTKEQIAGGNWQPCMTNPEGIEFAAETIKRFFAEHPEAESYSLGVNDGGGYCECPKCKALTRPDFKPGGCTSLQSYRVFPWMSAIADRVGQKYPDKILGCFAYLGNFAPPDGVKVNPMLMPYMTYSNSDLASPPFKDFTFKLMEDWGRRVKQIGQYDYGYGSCYLLPREYTPLVQEMLLHGLKCNLKGVYAEMYPNLSVDGPRLYLTAHLWWNPRLDLNALTNEWHQRMFRESAGPMKAHFDRCSRAIVSFRGYDKWSTVYRPYVPRTPPYAIFTPKILDECTADLDEAARLAKSDLVRRRVDFYRKTWRQVSVPFANGFWCGEGARQLIEAHAPLEEIAAALKRMPEANQPSDYERILETRVHEEPLAFYNKKPSTQVEIYRYVQKAQRPSLPIEDQDRYFAPPRDLPKESYQQLAKRLADEARAAGNADAVRTAVDRRIDVLFGAAGNAPYRAAVSEMRRLAHEPLLSSR